MGIDAVGAALAHLHGLSRAESKVLVYMAFRVLDKPNAKGQKPNLYYAGEVPLLSVVFGPKGDDEYTDSQVRYIRRTLASLRKKGLIEPLGQARSGTRQTWLQRYVFLTFEGGLSDHPQGGSTDHPEGGDSVPKRVVKQTTPRTHKDQVEDSFSGDTSTSQPSPKTARDESGAKDEGVSERWTDERCDHGHLVRNDTCAQCAETRHLMAGATPRPVLRLIEGETA